MKTIKAKSVIDGDNFYGEDGVNYRLRSVYAPESTRPGFKKCLQALEKLIKNKELEIINRQPNDSHKRPVVVVRVLGEKETVNDKMKKTIKDNGWEVEPL